MEEITTFVQENPAVSLIIAALVLVIIGLIILAIYQNRRYQEAIAPRFGFLGRPLYSFLAFAVLAGSLGFTILLGNQNASVDDALAGIQVSVAIDASVINPSSRNYQFRITPTANGLEWGPYSYDAYWTFNNADGTTTTALENALTRDNIGGVIKKLPSGINTIKVNVFVEDKNATAEIQVSVP